MLKFLALTTITSAKATWLIVRAIAYILGGILFGVLPLLIIVLVKVLKWSAKASVWTIGGVLAAALFIVRSA